jgi:hypothetical protein
MKYFFLVSGGRNGSLFLQSLTDGHPEILQLPGIFLVDTFFDKIQLMCNRRIENQSYVIASAFIEQHPEFFDSRINTIHRMGELGINQRDYFTVDALKFIEIYSKITVLEALDWYQIISNIHLAWSEAAGLDMTLKKVILIHIHHAKRLKRLKNIYSISNFRVVFMERDMLPSLVSELDGWKSYFAKYHKKPLALDFYSWSLNRKLLEPIRVIELDDKARSILLEALHIKTREVMVEFCKFLNINFNDCMLSSTFGAKLWWGDQLGEMKNGLNINFRNKLDESKFFQWEIDLLQRFVSSRRQISGYKGSVARPRSAVYFLLPGKMELQIFFNLLSSIKSIGSLLYALRSVVLFHKIILNKLEILSRVKHSKLTIAPLVRHQDN